MYVAMNLLWDCLVANQCVEIMRLNHDLCASVEYSIRTQSIPIMCVVLITDESVN